MILDRKIQLILMRKMQIVYPSYYDFDIDYPIGHQDRESALKNLYYLRAHELVEAKSVIITEYMDGDLGLDFGASTLTHHGMDFLTDDGGLSAILSVITIKFETQTLKAILATKINQSDLPPENKKSMIDALEELPSESIKHLTTKLLDECVDNLPAAILLIGTWLGSF